MKRRPANPVEALQGWPQPFLASLLGQASLQAAEPCPTASCASSGWMGQAATYSWRGYESNTQPVEDWVHVEEVQAVVDDLQCNMTAVAHLA